MMIDKEQEITGKVVTELRKKYPDMYIIDSPITNYPPNFPAVSIVQENSVVEGRYSTFDNLENASMIYFYIEIYDKDRNICKDIAKIIDDVLSFERYRRSLYQPFINEEATIQRRVMRYEKLEV